MSVAVCWRSGQIAVKRKIPDGALQLARGSAAVLREAICGSARLAYDGETWLVPGIPEADCEEDALSAYKAYRDRLIRSVAWLRSDKS